MDYEEMKLECLRLAVDAGHKGDDAIAMAKRFYDHCRDHNQNAPLSNAKLTVHGRDGDLGKFTDYVKRDE